MLKNSKGNEVILMKKKNGERIMHCVLRLQILFLFKIKTGLYYFSIQNTAISILRSIQDAEIHQGLKLRLKEFHILGGAGVESTCVLYEKSYIIQKSTNAQEKVC